MGTMEFHEQLTTAQRFARMGRYARGVKALGELPEGADDATHTQFHAMRGMCQLGAGQQNPAMKDLLAALDALRGRNDPFSVIVKYNFALASVLHILPATNGEALLEPRRDSLAESVKFFGQVAAALSPAKNLGPMLTLRGGVALGVGAQVAFRLVQTMRAEELAAKSTGVLWQLGRYPDAANQLASNRALLRAIATDSAQSYNTSTHIHHSLVDDYRYCW